MYKSLIIAGLLLGIAQSSLADYHLLTDRSQLDISSSRYNGTGEDKAFQNAYWVDSEQAPRYIAYTDSSSSLYWLKEADANGAGGSWFGDFEPGEDVVYKDGYHSPFYSYIRVQDSPNGLGTAIPIAAIGLDVQTLDYGDTMLEIRATDDNTWSDWLSTTGVSSFDPGSGPGFIGIASDTTNIKRVEVRAKPTGQSTFGWFAVNHPSFSYNPVPEPASLAVLGLGALAVLRRKQR